MRKRNIVMIASLMVGIFCFSGMSANAAQNEGQAGRQEEHMESRTANASQEESSEQQTEDINQEENPLPQPEDINQESDTEPQAENTVQEDTSKSKLCSLQIPQKMAIVIDPWEIDGKGQIYSEQYTIRNTGEATCVLTLSFLCKSGGDGAAIIRTDKTALHDDENKSIYIEVMFGETDKAVLTENGLEYQAQLLPGEELAISFTGEVNENASDAWRDGDVEIEGIYFWSIAEDAGAGTASDMDETKETPDSENNDADGLKEEPSRSGIDEPGNASTEGTHSPTADEPAENNDGQDGNAADHGNEPQDAEKPEANEEPAGNRPEEAGNPQAGTEAPEPAEQEESGPPGGRDHGEATPEESSEASHQGTKDPSQQGADSEATSGTAPRGTDQNS